MLKSGSILKSADISIEDIGLLNRISQLYGKHVSLKFSLPVLQEPLYEIKLLYLSFLSVALLRTRLKWYSVPGTVDNMMSFDRKSI